MLHVGYLRSLPSCVARTHTCLDGHCWWAAEQPTPHPNQDEPSPSSDLTDESHDLVRTTQRHGTDPLTLDRELLASGLRPNATCAARSSYTASYGWCFSCLGWLMRWEPSDLLASLYDPLYGIQKLPTKSYTHHWAISFGSSLVHIISRNCAPPQSILRYWIHHLTNCTYMILGWIHNVQINLYPKL